MFVERVMHPLDFDRHYFGDRQFRRQVAGYGTYSLQHLCSGVDQDQFWVPRYPDGGYLNCDLTPQTWNQLFPRQKRFFPENGLRQNRHYGESWVTYDLIKESDEATFRVIYDNQYHLGKVINTLNWRCKKIQLPGYMTAAFSTPETAINILDYLHRHRGVQVIYGPSQPFIEYVAEHAEPVDDCAATICTDIPGELVLAILPLGEAERAVLSGISEKDSCDTNRQHIAIP